MEKELHTFQGMSRGLYPINQKPELLWDAHNIRITDRGNNTLYSITNERGTKPTGITFEGKYVGHCVLNKFLVVFTHKDSESFIYRVEKTKSGYKKIILYHDEKELGLNSKYPIESLGYYESDIVQKVYWIDDNHQPRVINITKAELKEVYSDDIEDYTEILNYNSNSFDFVQSLSLNETVEIEKIQGIGMFAPGVIQYAFTYYNRYGQESNIFYTSPLYYIAHPDRGGSPEDKVLNSFKITINNIDKNFEYIRVYSIRRSSFEGTPVTTLVSDLAIDGDTVTYIDTGTTGSDVDFQQLLYMGGEDIFAKTMEAKDGVLFLGNIKLNRPSIDKKVKELFNSITEKTEDGYEFKDNNMKFSFREIDLSENISGKYYNYYNQLNSTGIAYFRSGEHYRLGIQFQHRTGRWSEPVVLNKDYTIPLSYVDDSDNSITLKPHMTGSTMSIPYMYYAENYEKLETVIDTLKKDGYVKARAVAVFPKSFERKIFIQGLVCPTMFNYKERYTGGLYSQPSWFLRPNVVGGIPPKIGLNDPTSEVSGCIPEFRHMHVLYRSTTRNAEIQSNGYSSVEISDGNTIGAAKGDVITSGEISTIKDLHKLDPYDYADEYLIDQSILNIYSPDVEFNPDFYNIPMYDLKFRLIGLVPFNTNVSDMTVETSSTVADVNAQGFTKVNVANTNSGACSLLTGLFYEDVTVLPKSDTDSTAVIGTDLIKYPIYPWHRSGSLNSDYIRSDTNGVQTSILMKKVISNLKYSKDIIWSKNYYLFNNIADPQLCKVESGELVKVNGHTYISDIDQLATRKNKYAIYSVNPDDNTLKALTTSTDPIRIKYKSVPHIVLQLKSDEENSDIVLPYIPGTAPTDVDTVPSNPEVTGVFKPISVFCPLYEGDKHTSKTGKGKYIIDKDFVKPPYTNIKGKYCLIYKDGKMAQPGEPSTEKGWYLGICLYDLYTKDELLFVETLNSMVSVGSIIRVFHADGETVQEKCNESKAYYHYYKITEKYTANREKGRIELKLLQDYNPNSNTETRGEETEEGNKEVSIVQEEWNFDKDYDISSIPSYLFMGELYREAPENCFGGDSENDIINNTSWLPVGEPVSLDSNESGKFILPFTYGDTYYQRYDLLKSYPYTKEDENGIVEIGSFMCETPCNIDGRYDRNRGLTSNVDIRPEIFNQYNEVYSQTNNLFTYRIFNEDYYKQDSFPTQFIWSLAKSAANEVDPWTNVNMASVHEVDGDNGAITAIVKFNDTLICIQENAINTIPFNVKGMIEGTDGVAIEITNGGRVDDPRVLNSHIGCQDKWSINNETLSGIYFVDNNTGGLYKLGESPENIGSSSGMQWWALENVANKWLPYSEDEKNGIRTFYDPVYQDIYFTPGQSSNQIEALCFSEYANVFTSFMSYGGTQAMFSFEEQFMSLRDDGILTLWENNKGRYNEFYGEYKPYNFTFVSNANPTYTKIFDTVEYSYDQWEHEDSPPIIFGTFNEIRAWNEYQDTGVVKPNSKKKFRIWRSLIPRNENTRQRIRNPWTFIQLGNSQEDYNKMILHNITVNYSV